MSHVYQGPSIFIWISNDIVGTYLEEKNKIKQITLSPCNKTAPHHHSLILMYW